MLEFRLKSLKPSKDAHANLGEPIYQRLTLMIWSIIKNLRINLPVHGTKFQRKSKETFERIGIPEAERAYLAGASAQYESEVVYHNMKKSLKSWGLSLPIRILP